MNCFFNQILNNNHHVKGNPRQTARDAESCRLANSKQLTKGQPDLQLSHKIKSMPPPVLCKHPLWLFITKWSEL